MKAVRSGVSWEANFRHSVSQYHTYNWRKKRTHFNNRMTDNCLEERVDRQVSLLTLPNNEGQKVTQRIQSTVLCKSCTFQNVFQNVSAGALGTYASVQGGSKGERGRKERHQISKVEKAAGATVNMNSDWSSNICCWEIVRGRCDVHVTSMWHNGSAEAWITLYTTMVIHSSHR